MYTFTIFKRKSGLKKWQQTKKNKIFYYNTGLCENIYGGLTPSTHHTRVQAIIYEKQNNFFTFFKSLFTLTYLNGEIRPPAWALYHLTAKRVHVGTQCCLKYVLTDAVIRRLTAATNEKRHVRSTALLSGNNSKTTNAINYFVLSSRRSSGDTSETKNVTKT